MQFFRGSPGSRQGLGSDRCAVRQRVRRVLIDHHTTPRWRREKRKGWLTEGVVRFAGIMHPLPTHGRTLLLLPRCTRYASSPLPNYSLPFILVLHPPLFGMGEGRLATPPVAIFVCTEIGSIAENPAKTQKRQQQQQARRRRRDKKRNTTHK